VGPRQTGFRGEWGWAEVLTAMPAGIRGGTAGARDISRRHMTARQERRRAPETVRVCAEIIDDAAAAYREG
jgi:hypothetical protein